jgi:hypothetical protein
LKRRGYGGGEATPTGRDGKRDGYSRGRAQMQHTLPNDILHIIFTFYDLFQQVEAEIRLNEFRCNYSKQWSIIMSEIQGYTPRYTVTAKTYDDTRFTLSLFLPDCDLRGFSNVAQFNSWDYTYQRKVLNIDSRVLRWRRRHVRNEIIHPIHLTP